MLKEKLTWNRKRVLFWVRVTVSVVLLIYLFTIIQWDRMTALLSKTDTKYLVFAPTIFLIGFLFSAMRWHYLLRSFKIFQRIKHLYTYYLIGLFYSIFLPGAIGGDVIRIGICAKKTKSSIGVVSITALIERICGVVALFSMGSVMVFYLPQEILAALNETVLKSLPLGTVLLLVLLTILFAVSKRFHTRFLNEEKASGRIKKVLQILKQVIHLPYSTIFFTIVFSAFFQTADILASFAIAKALKISVPLKLFFVVIPIVYISTVLPVSLGGLGVREGVLVYMLSKVNVVSSDAVALSFLIHLNRVIVGAIGGLIQLFWKKRET